LRGAEDVGVGVVLLDDDDDMVGAAEGGGAAEGAGLEGLAGVGHGVMIALE
jgi:hypothetical protein